MPGKTQSLDNVKVAFPCQVSWDNMSGSETVRFCSECQHRVYNLSEMTRQQAEELVLENEGRLCVRYYRRPDGTLMTKDCPKSNRAFRRLAAAIVALAAVMILVFITSVSTIFALSHNHETGRRTRPNSVTAAIRNIPPLRQIHDWLFPPPPPVILGKLMPPPPMPKGE